MKKQKLSGTFQTLQWHGGPLYKKLNNWISPVVNHVWKYYHTFAAKFFGKCVQNTLAYHFDRYKPSAWYLFHWFVIKAKL